MHCNEGSQSPSTSWRISTGKAWLCVPVTQSFVSCVCKFRQRGYAKQKFVGGGRVVALTHPEFSTMITVGLGLMHLSCHISSQFWNQGGSSTKREKARCTSMGEA